MSVRVVSAVLDLGANMPALIATIGDVKRRPSWQTAQLVSLVLADRYQPARGYVDETVEQIAQRVPVGDVRPALQALDTIGVWAVSKRGHQGRGTRRVPGWLLASRLSGAGPAERGVETVGDLGGADPAQTGAGLSGVDGSSRRGSDSVSAGWGPRLGGADPATPPSSPCTTTSSSSSVSPERREDATTTTIRIIVKAKEDRASPRNVSGWRLTVTANEQAESGAEIRSRLAEGMSPVDVAGLVLGSPYEARSAARSLGIDVPPDLFERPASTREDPSPATSDGASESHDGNVVGIGAAIARALPRPTSEEARAAIARGYQEGRRNS